MPDAQSPKPKRSRRRDRRAVGLAITAYAALAGVALIDAFYSAAPPPVTPGNLVIPVQDVSAADLRSQFREQRSGGRTHRAIDIRAALGTPVLAADDGSIARLTRNRLGGLTVYQFDRAKRRVYYYAHLHRYASGLEENATVRRGQVIGYVGTSGNAPEEAPHLHFAVSSLAEGDEWWEGRPLDPYDLLTRR
jgi:murein DD-endopeptidase MepM/ murein hydrolase activator NlpD